MADINLKRQAVARANVGLNELAAAGTRGCFSQLLAKKKERQDKQKERKTDRQTDRQTERQTERQKDRKKDRKTDPRKVAH